MSKIEPRSPLKSDEFRIAPRRKSLLAEEESDFAEERAASTTIPPSWLAEVQDDTVGIRQNEADAYYRILAKVQSTSQSELLSHAEHEALFVNLITSPEKYRGRPVTITGEVRKLFEIPHPENDYGLTRLYEAWICTAESGENPYRVVCSSIPPEIKPQDSSRADVIVTGCFFKREGYLTQDGRLHVAPTVLAHRISLYIPPQSPPPVEDVVPWMVGVISVIGLAMLATVIGYAVSDSRGRRRQSLQDFSAADVNRLSHADQRLSVEESLRRLTEDDLVQDDEESEEPSLNGNGHSRLSDLPEEFVELPTPFPPTRVPRRFDHPN